MGLSSSIKSILPELKKKRNINKRKNMYKILLLPKVIRLKLAKNEAIKNLFDLKTKSNKNIFDPKREDIAKHILELKRRNKIIKNTVKIRQKSEIKTKNYYDYDDIEYKGIKDVKYMYDDIYDDYYKLIRTGNAFSSNCIEYESNADKDKLLWIKVYLDKIKPYLRNMINNLMTEDEWKTQLIMAINLF